MARCLWSFLEVMNLKINIMGTEYTVNFYNYTDKDIFEKRNICGYHCGNTKEIAVGRISTFPGFEEETDVFCEVEEKSILRHEIVHAFLCESGLQDSTLPSRTGWAMNEEMVDWISSQAPKLLKAFQEAECL